MEEEVSTMGLINGAGKMRRVLTFLEVVTSELEQ